MGVGGRLAPPHPQRRTLALSSLFEPQPSWAGLPTPPGGARARSQVLRRWSGLPSLAPAAGIEPRAGPAGGARVGGTGTWSGPCGRGPAQRGSAAAARPPSWGGGGLVWPPPRRPPGPAQSGGPRHGVRPSPPGWCGGGPSSHAFADWNWWRLERSEGGRLLVVPRRGSNGQQPDTGGRGDGAGVARAWGRRGARPPIAGPAPPKPRGWRRPTTAPQWAWVVDLPRPIRSGGRLPCQVCLNHSRPGPASPRPPAVPARGLRFCGAGAGFRAWRPQPGLSPGRAPRGGQG
mmetsp:Transcript_43240/g.104346  ORF Transcript_43240/g.104346 Transcript_43240/m.104346 type:complete len:289 (+) Transcript_43240:227-1093(+)